MTSYESVNLSLFLVIYAINRKSYMIAHALVNLLNKLGKEINFAPSLNRSMNVTFYSSYNINITLKRHLWGENIKILSLCMQQKYVNIALVLTSDLQFSRDLQTHLSFKSVCNKEHKGVICNMTSLINSSQSTHPTG